mmetsp:Transcript_9522/g.21012  ORF Transcript_9522/g.21012 Transcript_9522/m.21012 type:complete len:336 (-) Transcript_9522:42-1049(-)
MRAPIRAALATVVLGAPAGLVALRGQRNPLEVGSAPGAVAAVPAESQVNSTGYLPAVEHNKPVKKEQPEKRKPTETGREAAKRRSTISDREIDPLESPRSTRYDVGTLPRVEFDASRLARTMFIGLLMAGLIAGVLFLFNFCDARNKKNLPMSRSTAGLGDSEDATEARLLRYAAEEAHYATPAEKCRRLAHVLQPREWNPAPGDDRAAEGHQCHRCHNYDPGARVPYWECQKCCIGFCISCATPARGSASNHPYPAADEPEQVALLKRPAVNLRPAVKSCRSSGHPMQLTKSFRGGYANGWRCDNCGTRTSNPEVPFNKCRTCELDLCNTCARG